MLLSVPLATSEQLAGSLSHSVRGPELIPRSKPQLHGCELGFLRQAPNVCDTALDGNGYPETHGFRARNTDEAIVRPRNRFGVRTDTALKGVQELSIREWFR
jgi:hypothetical protein